MSLRAVAMMGWRPIETAPKDGTRVLLAWSTGADPFDWDIGVGAWGEWISGNPEHEGWFWIADEPLNNVTHWMPLPSPPDFR